MKVLKKLILVMIFAGLGAELFASPYDAEVTLDNQFIQTYKEKEGIWLILQNSRKSVWDLLTEFGSSEEEFRKINELSDKESIPVRKPLFFPYSSDYVTALLKEQKGRDIVQSDARLLIWPVNNKHSTITSRLGRRWHKLHTGVDIGCPTGTLVIASGDGVVLEAKRMGGYGLAIVIYHPELHDIKTLYAHNSFIFVKSGDTVKKGQVIAFSGNTGHTTGPHVHFEVRYNEVVLNPEHYLPPFHTELDNQMAVAKETVEID